MWDTFPGHLGTAGCRTSLLPAHPPALPLQQMAKEYCGILRTRCIAEAPNSAAYFVEIRALSHHSDSVNVL